MHYVVRLFAEDMYETSLRVNKVRRDSSRLNAVKAVTPPRSGSPLTVVARDTTREAELLTPPLCRPDLH